MLNFFSTYQKAASLFHSSNIDELMEPGALGATDHATRQGQNGHSKMADASQQPEASA
jgi:hypothetical protein